jgi:hypothetical protein
MSATQAPVTLTTSITLSFLLYLEIYFAFGQFLDSTTTHPPTDKHSSDVLSLSLSLACLFDL